VHGNPQSQITTCINSPPDGSLCLPFVPPKPPCLAPAKHDISLQAAILHQLSNQPGWQVWNEKDEQDEVLAMVVRTGLHTFVGQMLTPLVHRHWAPRRPQLRTPLGLLRQVSLLMLMLPTEHIPCRRAGLVAVILLFLVMKAHVHTSALLGSATLL